MQVEQSTYDHTLLSAKFHGHADLFICSYLASQKLPLVYYELVKVTK